MERRTEGGGMLVGGGPEGEVVSAGFGAGGVSFEAPQSSQSQSELAVAVFAVVVFSETLFIASFAGRDCTATLGDMSSNAPQSASKLFFSFATLVSSSFSNVGHAVTGEGVLGLGSFGNSSPTGVFSPNPGKGLRSWNEGDFGGCGYGDGPSFRLRVERSWLGGACLACVGRRAKLEDIKSKDGCT